MLTLRGRTRENILDLMIEGIKEADPNKPYEITRLPNEEAVKYTLSKAKPGAFLVTLSDAVKDAVGIVQMLQEEERMK